MLPSTLLSISVKSRKKPSRKVCSQTSAFTYKEKIMGKKSFVKILGSWKSLQFLLLIAIDWRHPAKTVLVKSLIWISVRSVWNSSGDFGVLVFWWNSICGQLKVSVLNTVFYTVCIHLSTKRSAGEIISILASNCCVSWFY